MKASAAWHLFSSPDVKDKASQSSHAGLPSRRRAARQDASPEIGSRLYSAAQRARAALFAAEDRAAVATSATKPAVVASPSVPNFRPPTAVRSSREQRAPLSPQPGSRVPLSPQPGSGRCLRGGGGSCGLPHPQTGPAVLEGHPPSASSRLQRPQQRQQYRQQLGQSYTSLDGSARGHSRQSSCPTATVVTDSVAMPAQPSVAVAVPVAQVQVVASEAEKAAAVRTAEKPGSINGRQRQQPRQQQQRQVQGNSLQRRRSLPPQQEEALEKEDQASHDVSDRHANIPYEYAKLAHKGSLFRTQSLLPPVAQREHSDVQRQTSAHGPVLLGHPLTRAEVTEKPLEPKVDVDAKTKVPESIFKAMEKLGHAARNRGQHVLQKSARSRGRPTLVRHDVFHSRREDGMSSCTSEPSSARSPASEIARKLSSRAAGMLDRQRPTLSSSQAWRTGFAAESRLRQMSSKDPLQRSF
eukprot:TRINITY_DN8704_c0_g1_i1.p1 TRINITY_DN8704_c0_g1~~TRINITY_DN8704_c0_g1_i1.p1  ORF type:complete len:534 (-),score=109.61 TRINITY_DN8704_c0_g1_i1:89-1492(-)